MGDFLCPHCGVSYRHERTPRKDSRRLGTHALEPCFPCETMDPQVAIACAAIRARIRTGLRLPFATLRTVKRCRVARNLIERDMSVFLPGLKIDWAKLVVATILGARPAT